MNKQIAAPKNLEELLKLWFEQEPSIRSPYKLYGCPPMWATAEDAEGRVLYTRPCRTMVRDTPFMPYRETDGVSYQWRKGDKWDGQGYQDDFDYFFKKVLT